MNFYEIPEKNIIFYWSPKCGCTTLKQILIDYLKIPPSDSIHGGILDQHYRNKEFSKNEKFTRVMIYRDPYKRLVSGFLDTTHRNNILNQHENVNNVNNFEEFVNFLYCINIKNRHFLPQTHNITDTKMDIFINVNNINQISNLLTIPSGI